MTETLEPKLTPYDLSVLRAVPPDRKLTVWRIGDQLDELDLGGLTLTLNGLAHLGYVLATWHPRNRTSWIRLSKGDEALRGP